MKFSIVCIPFNSFEDNTFFYSNKKSAETAFKEFIELGDFKVVEMYKHNKLIDRYEHSC